MSKIKSVLGAGLLVALPSGAAFGADMPTTASAAVPPPVYNTACFLDLGAGVGFARADSLLYNDLVGTAFTTNPVLGSDIVPSNIVNTDKSFAAAVAVGRFVTDNIYLKGAYRYFGSYNASGFAAFPPGANFQQLQKSTAHGAFFGLGATYDLTRQFYLDASAELGGAFVRSSGIHDANVFPQPFPKAWSTNLAVGAGLGLGYRMTSNLDLTLTGNYYYLGNASTGITCHCIPGTPGEHASEHLSSKLTVVPILVGIRFKM